MKSPAFLYSSQPIKALIKSIPSGIILVSLLFNFLLIPFSFAGKNPYYKKMKIPVHVFDHSKEIGAYAADQFFFEVEKANESKQPLLFILPTGSTPIPMYQAIIKRFKQQPIDLSKVITFNMDEYAGLPATHKQSYRYFMDKHFHSYLTPGVSLRKLKNYGLKKNRMAGHAHLIPQMKDFRRKLLTKLEKESDPALAVSTTYKEFQKTNRDCSKLFDSKRLPSPTDLIKAIELDRQLAGKMLRPENIYIADGSLTPKQAEAQYAKEFARLSLIENLRVVLFGGIGPNPPHIAFNELINEPTILAGKSLSDRNQRALNTGIRLVPLAPGTIKANSRFFKKNPKSVPKSAITIGFQQIMNADRVIIMANGEQKQQALLSTFAEEPSYLRPASLLQYHKNQIHFLVDKRAVALLDPKKIPKLNSTIRIIENSKRHLIKKLSQTDHLINLDLEDMKTLPKNKNIMTIGVLPETNLFNQLRSNNRIIEVDFQHLNPKKDTPDLLLLKASQLAKLSTMQLLPDFQNTLTIVYDDLQPHANSFFPLTQTDIASKSLAMRQFHPSQTKRSAFDKIVEAAAYELWPQLSARPKGVEGFMAYKFDWATKKKHKFSDFTYFTTDHQAPLTIDENTHVIAFAPHPDDGEIGLGGVINSLKKIGNPITVFNLTTGHRALINKKHLADAKHFSKETAEGISGTDTDYITDTQLKSRLRAEESQHALAYLNPKVTLHSLSLPFYKNGTIETNDAEILKLAIEKSIYSHPKTQKLFFFIPSLNDAHKTHRQSHDLAEKVLCMLEPKVEHDTYIFHYYTPWFGDYQVYEYSNKFGSEFVALVGAELLASNGQSALPLAELGGNKAARYQVRKLKQILAKL